MYELGKLIRESTRDNHSSCQERNNHKQYLRTNSTTLDVENQQYTATFTEVHQWINNFFNSTYSGTDDEHGIIGALIDNETEDYNDEYNEQYVIAFNK
eukprot:6491230-Amphidinium_carterae.1